MGDNHDSVPHLIVDAARIAAPVFKQEGWMYALVEGGQLHQYIPSEADIAEKIQALLADGADLYFAEWGRVALRSAVTETGTQTLSAYLLLGTYEVPEPAVAMGGE